MIRSVLIVISIILFVNPPASQAQPIVIGESYTIDSEILEEERPYLVSLPESYFNSKYLPRSYPVLYLLDGEARFQSAAGVVNFMSPGVNGNSQVPEMIIVAIPNTDRDRDLTPTISSDGIGGGGDNFLNFIENELSPLIDRTYRTSPFRIIVGHSHGGLLAIQSLFDKPSLFQSYIVIEPSLWWDNQIMVTRLSDIVRDSDSLEGSMYVALANNPGTNNPVEKAIRDFATSLEGINSETFRSTLQYFEQEDHASSPLLSLYHGLLYIFDEFNPFTEEFFMNPSAQSLSLQYQRLSQTLGWDVLPSESAVDQLGNAMLYQVRNVQMAIELLELNVQNYPESYNAHLSLGNALIVGGDKIQALEYLENSLDLSPNNREVQSKIKELSGI